MKTIRENPCHPWFEKLKLRFGRSLTLQVVLLSALFAREVAAQTSLSVGHVPGYPVATVAVPIALRQATNVTAAQFDVAYNAGRVSAGSNCGAASAGGAESSIPSGGLISARRLASSASANRPSSPRGGVARGVAS